MKHMLEYQIFGKPCENSTRTWGSTTFYAYFIGWFFYLDKVKI